MVKLCGGCSERIFSDAVADIDGSLWHRGCLEAIQAQSKIRRVISEPPTEEAQLKQERDALQELIEWAKGN